MWLSDVTVRAPRLKRQSTTLAEPKPKLTLDGLFSAISCSSSGDGWFVVLLSKRGKAAQKADCCEISADELPRLPAQQSAPTEDFQEPQPCLGTTVSHPPYSRTLLSDRKQQSHERIVQIYFIITIVFAVYSPLLTKLSSHIAANG